MRCQQPNLNLLGQKKLPKYLESQLLPSKIMLTQENMEMSVTLQEDKEGTEKRVFSLFYNKRPSQKKNLLKETQESFSTQESLAKSSPTTLSDKKNLSESGGSNIETHKKDLKKSRISGLVSITGDPAYEGFSRLLWKTELPLHLPLPVQIGLPGSELTSLLLLSSLPEGKLSSLIDMEHRKAVNRNSLKTCFPSSMSSRLELWVEDAMEKQKDNLKTNLLLAAKIRLKPSKTQRQVLKRWFGAVRWSYNKSLESLKGKETSKDKKLSYALRNKFVTVKDNNLPDWVSEIPKEVRKTGTDEASVAWKNRSEKSTFDFRKKKDKHQSLCISRAAIKSVKGREDLITIFKRTLGQVKCNKGMLTKVLKKKGAFSHDSKLTFNGTNYFLHVLYEPSLPDQKQFEDVVGLDPGVRTFLTGYSPNEIQNLEYKTDFSRVWRMKRKIELSKTKKEKWKNENLLTDQIRSAHIAVSKDLTSKFSHLILGKFDTQKLTEKAGSKLSKKTRIEIGCLSHYKFRERLSLECVKNGSSLRVVPEHFTSKTCGGCGKINETLGASKVFECRECGGCFDRDSNAARNMIVKYLVASKV